MRGAWLDALVRGGPGWIRTIDVSATWGEDWTPAWRCCLRTMWAEHPRWPRFGADFHRRSGHYLRPLAGPDFHGRLGLHGSTGMGAAGLTPASVICWISALLGAQTLVLRFGMASPLGSGGSGLRDRCRPSSLPASRGITSCASRLRRPGSGSVPGPLPCTSSAMSPSRSGWPLCFWFT